MRCALPDDFFEFVCGSIGWIWPNLSFAGQFHEPHTHSSIQFAVAGVYYVQVPKFERAKDGALSFIDPRGGAVGSDDYASFYGLSQELRLQPLAGCLVLFPPHLKHYVYPHTAATPRISLAFDVSARVPDSLLTLEHWRKHSEHLLEEHAEGSAVRLFVFTPDESEIVGTVGLTRITRGVRFDCSLSYAVREAYEGAGMMSEAVHAAIRHAFDDLGMHRIETAHALDNQKSQKLLERMGFERVGVIRGFLLTGGRWRDTLLHSLLNPDWQPR